MAALGRRARQGHAARPAAGPARADEGLHRARPIGSSTSRGLDATITATPDGGLRIGAAVKLVDLAGACATVEAQYPALTQAAAEVGTPQIRNLGTVGGNLMQRPRCWYFRNEEFAA